MKKLKLILPMLAFIFAIALSFAFVNTASEEYYTTGYIQIGANWYQVDVDCNEGNFDCKVEIQGEPGTEYQVYADESTSHPLESNSDQPKLIPDPR